VVFLLKVLDERSLSALELGLSPSWSGSMPRSIRCSVGARFSFRGHLGGDEIGARSRFRSSSALRSDRSASPCQR
jgi:hypothetical protein